MWFPMEPFRCLLCIDKMSDCRIIPGDSETTCSCKEMAVCIECMLRHYLENSDCSRKSFAVCPKCRGEFTLNSLILVKYEPIQISNKKIPRDSVSPSLAKSITISKKTMRQSKQHSNMN